MSGKVQAILAKSVILCTGGCGRVFPFTTNAAIKNGDGMALAYRAGAPLKDMEFVQYHPTGLPFTGILITEAARAEGGYMLNKDGYRYLQDYNLGTPEPKPVLRSMELGPRDRLSQAFVKEFQKGRTVETPHGHVVHLDLRHLGEKLINARLPFVRELCLKYQNIDPVKELVPVRPVVHYMMGGVSTDINGASPLRGLLAAGEVACVSINGANRLGSNSLPECLVFGARAGRVAAEFASEQEPGNGAVLAQAQDEERRLESQYLRKTGGRERIATIRVEMQSAMENVRGYLSRRTVARRRARPSCASCRSGMRTSIWMTAAAPSTPSWSRRWNSASCWMWRSRWCSVRCIARNRAARISGSTIPTATTRNFWRIRWCIATRMAPREWSICR